MFFYVIFLILINIIILSVYVFVTPILILSIAEKINIAKGKLSYFYLAVIIFSALAVDLLIIGFLKFSYPNVFFIDSIFFLEFVRGTIRAIIIFGLIGSRIKIDLLKIAIFSILGVVAMELFYFGMRFLVLMLNPEFLEWLVI